MKFGITIYTIGQKTTTGGGGVRGGRGRGSAGCHYHQQDLMILFPTAIATFAGVMENLARI